MSAEDDDAADRAFEQRARSELRRGLEETPADVATRLDESVQLALNQPRRPRLTRFALPAGAVAALAVILVAQPWRQPDAPEPAATDDFALLIDGDNLDLLEQMEFYRWLDQQPGILDDATVPGSAQRS